MGPWAQTVQCEVYDAVVEPRRREDHDGDVAGVDLDVEQHEICPGLDTIPVRTGATAQ